MSQSQYSEMHTRTHKQVAHVVIVLARPFHTSKLKIDACYKQLATNTTTDAVAMPHTLAALIGAADVVECI